MSFKCGGGRLVAEWMYPEESVEVSSQMSSSRPHNLIQSGRTLLVEFPDVEGSGITVTARATLVGNNNGGNVNFSSGGIGNLGGGGQVNGRIEYNIQFSRRVILRSMRLWDFDGLAYEQMFGMVPRPTVVDPPLVIGGCNGNGSPQAGDVCVRGQSANSTGDVQYNVELTHWTFMLGWPNGLGIAISDYSFTVPKWKPAYLDLCKDEHVWRDLATGEPIDAALLRRNSLGGQ